jgi:hypothetical protein
MEVEDWEGAGLHELVARVPLEGKPGWLRRRARPQAQLPDLEHSPV